MKRSSERSELLDLDAGVPTTPADVEALRRLGGRLDEGLLAEANRLRAPTFFGPPLFRRRTFEGCEPFEL